MCVKKYFVVSLGTFRSKINYHAAHVNVILRLYYQLAGYIVSSPGGESWPWRRLIMVVSFFGDNLFHQIRWDF